MNVIQSEETDLVVVCFILLLLFGVVSGGLFLAVDNLDLHETEVALTGDTTSDGGTVESAIMYEDLPEEEQSKFREEQSLVYNAERTGDVVFSKNHNIYSDYTHISLDGTYYELTSVTSPTLFGGAVIIFYIGSVLGVAIFGTATVLATVVVLADSILHRVSLETVERVTLAFAIVFTLVGGLMPMAGFVYSDPITATEVSEPPQQNVQTFSQLSETEQSTFVSIVSGGSLPADETTLEKGMYVQSDGEVYKLESDSIGTRNIWLALISGIISLFIGLAPYGFLGDRKKDFIQDNPSEAK